MIPHLHHPRHGRNVRVMVSAAGTALGAAATLGLILTVPAVARSGPQTVAPVAEKLLDAVVNISTTQNVKGQSGVPLPRVPKGSPFEDLFEDFFNRKGSSGPQNRKVSSLGSGFVIDGVNGLIVTNHHVIEGADEIIANFADGSKLKVDKVLGKDTKTDLALLKVTPKKPLPAVKFGSSTTLKVGDWVMAIGNPFGLGGSVTVGIISAKQRDINSGPYDDYLQTDAAINKGNSGGPLFNMDGDVIGVNTAIISPTGGSIGIGFAVPSDTAIAVVEQLRLYGETRRGWLGVNIQSVTEELAESLGVKAGAGALVSRVNDEGPAAKAGVVAGDIIVKFDGKEVSAVRSLPRLVAQTPIGKAVELEVLRKGERKVLKVVVGRLSEGGEADKDKAPDAGAGGAGAADVAALGLKIAPLNESLRQTYKLSDKVKGLVVTEVASGGPAEQNGIKVGDVIVEAGQEAVSDVDQVAKAIDKVRKSGRKSVLLRVEDAKGDLRFVAVPLN